MSSEQRAGWLEGTAPREAPSPAQTPGQRVCGAHGPADALSWDPASVPDVFCRPHSRARARLAAPAVLMLMCRLRRAGLGAPPTPPRRRDPCGLSSAPRAAADSCLIGEPGSAGPRGPRPEGRELTRARLCGAHAAAGRGPGAPGSRGPGRGGGSRLAAARSLPGPGRRAGASVRAAGSPWRRRGWGWGVSAGRGAGATGTPRAQPGLRAGLRTTLVRKGRAGRLNARAAQPADVCV